MPPRPGEGGTEVRLGPDLIHLLYTIAEPEPPWRIAMMTRRRNRLLFQLLSLACLLCPLCPVWADDVENREFSVIVDGKDAGFSRTKITQTGDGTTYMTGAVDVKFRHLLVLDYVLKIDTQEWWKDGRLIGLKTTSSENGKKAELTAAIENNQLRLRVNGQERLLKPDIWTTSFWKLADARFHNKPIGILEVDTGREFNCELKYLGTEKLKVAGEFQECYHFRVAAAPVPVDLWYDRYHRIVRQEFTESGHKTIVQLIKITR
jgi:Family of unknown function (DUF6134)